LNRKLVLVLILLTSIVSPIYIHSSIFYTQKNVNTFNPDLAISLGSGTAGTSEISVNGTSASVNVSAAMATTMWLYVNSDDETRTEWNRVGTNPYLDAIDYNTNYVHSSLNNMEVGDFGFADSGKSTDSINNVTVQVYAQQSNSKTLEVHIWNGSSWMLLGIQTLTTSWRWENFSATTILDTWTKIDGVKIYLISTNAAGIYEVDCVRLQVDYTPPNTYDYVLNVTSQKAYDQNISLNLYGYSNINRLANCTIWFHDGTSSVQINITNGVVIQDVGPWYLLSASATRYIAVYVEESTSGTSILSLELEAMETNSIIYTCLIELRVD
jgi:hypothetical protein